MEYSLSKRLGNPRKTDYEMNKEILSDKNVFDIFVHIYIDIFVHKYNNIIIRI
jgi:hypothetical protein